MQFYSSMPKSLFSLNPSILTNKFLINCKKMSNFAPKLLCQILIFWSKHNCFDSKEPQCSFWVDLKIACEKSGVRGYCGDVFNFLFYTILSITVFTPRRPSVHSTPINGLGHLSQKSGLLKPWNWFYYTSWLIPRLHENRLIAKIA